MKTLQELQPLILEWAKEKDLLKFENAPKQRLKLLEEVGETAGAILKNKTNDIKDGIGDIFVVLVIINAQIDGDLEFDIDKMDSSFFENLSDILKDIAYSFSLSGEISSLNEICLRLNLNLTECANLAWNEIKDRKGNTINGVFIKNN